MLPRLINLTQQYTGLRIALSVLIGLSWGIGSTGLLASWATSPSAPSRLMDILARLFLGSGLPLVTTLCAIGGLLAEMTFAWLELPDATDKSVPQR